MDTVLVDGLLCVLLFTPYCSLYGFSLLSPYDTLIVLLFHFFISIYGPSSLIVRSLLFKTVYIAVCTVAKYLSFDLLG